MAQPLRGCVIAVSGSFSVDGPKAYTHPVIGSMINAQGGRYNRRVTRDCTHLLATECDYNRETDKVKQALKRPRIKVVGIKWLEDCISRERLEDETPYLMVKTNSAIAVNNVDKGKKRTRDGIAKQEEIEGEEEDEEVEGPPAKKQKEIEGEEEDEEVEEPPAKKQKDEQKVKSKELHIPVDEVCDLKESHHVFIAMDGTIFDAALTQTDLGKNANKFYRMQLLEPNGASGNEEFANYRTWTRWGRVGERGQGANFGWELFDDAINHFNSKFKEKTGHAWDNRLKPPKKGRYTYIERNYEEDSEDNENELPGAGSRRGSKESVKSDTKRKIVESNLPASVQDLMRVIFNKQYFTAAMDAMSYDSNKLPLGKLSKRTLMSGYERLKELAELLANPNLADEVHNMSYTDAITELSSSYYTYIPHSFGRSRPPIICNDDILKKEIELLESLSDMSIAEEIMKEAKEDVTSIVHPLDRQYAGLGMAEMAPLNHKSTEFKELHSYLIKTHGVTHSMKFKIEEIFRIERNGEADRFNKSPYAKFNGDRRLLWHGSRCTNFGGILSQGLRIAPPEAPATGYMFGKGVYLADISSKSALYCQHKFSGGIGLLLLCEAELGKPMLELTDAESKAGVLAKEKGCYATWGKGMTGPVAWKDAESVNKNLKGVLMPDTSQPPTATGVEGASLYYNEYVCYDMAQIRLRYLFRVKISAKDSL